MSASNIPMHKKTLYNRAIKCNMKEKEYAEINGFKKVEIGRKMKFIYNIK